MELGLIHLDRTGLYCLYMGEMIWSNSHFIDFFGFTICQTRSKEAGSYSSNSRISREVLVGQIVRGIPSLEEITLKILSSSEFLFPCHLQRHVWREIFFFLPSSNQIHSQHPYSHCFVRDFLGRVSTTLLNCETDKTDEIYFLFVQLDIKEFWRL